MLRYTLCVTQTWSSTLYLIHPTLELTRIGEISFLYTMATILSTMVFFTVCFVRMCSCSTEGFQRNCSIFTNRQQGVIPNRHVWVCGCTNDDGTEFVRGRVDHELDLTQNTTGHELAILRCQRKNRDHLLRSCRGGADQYQRRAAPILRHCINTPLNTTEKALTTPFAFKKDQCESRFVRFLLPQIGGVLVCQCFQEIELFFQYIVVSGRVAFLTNNAPSGAENEVSTLEECTNEAIAQLEDVCLRTPGDFQLLALQLLEVCCKRARVQFEEKFECKSAVPDESYNFV